MRWVCCAPAAAVLVAALLGGCRKPAYHESLARGDQLLESDPAAAMVEYQRALDQGALAQGNAGLGFAEERLGKYSGALAHLRVAKEKAPNDLRVRLALGRIHVIRSELDQARRELTFVAENRASGIAAPLLLAAVADDSKTAEAAETHLERARVRLTAQGDPVPLELAVALAELEELRRKPLQREQLKRQLGEAKLHGAELAATLAEVYARRGRVEPAARLLSAVVAVLPQRADLWLSLSAAQLGRSRLGEAEAALNRAEKLAPRDPQALRARAQLHERRGRPEQAAASLARAHALLPASATAQRRAVTLARARALIKAGHEGDAMRLLKELVGKHSDDPQARVMLGALQLKAGANENAIATLTPAVRSARAPAEAVKLLGAAQLAAGDVAAAEATFRAYIDQTPERPHGYIMLASWLKDRGDPKGARAQYALALERSPESLAALRGLAAIEAADGEHPEAAARFLRPLAKKARAPWQHHDLLGDLYLEWGQQSAAAEAFQRAVDLRPGLVATWIKLARTWTALRRQGEAIHAALQAVKHSHHSDLSALELLAKLQRKAGRIEESSRSYQAMLKLDPKSVVALNNLAMLNGGSLGKLDEGLEYAERAYRQDPLPAVQDTLGWLLYQRGRKQDLERAVKLLASAARALNTADVLYHLGVAQLRAGEVQSGRQNLRRALKLSSDFAGAKEARAALDQSG